MNDIKYPLYEDDLFSKAKRFDDYIKTKNFYVSMNKQVEILEAKIKIFTTPRNPRQEVNQTHDKNTLRRLKTQILHLEEKLGLLEMSIQKDIENSKNENK